MIEQKSQVEVSWMYTNVLIICDFHSKLALYMQNELVVLNILENPENP